jgi:hypothetical protein
MNTPSHAILNLLIFNQQLRTQASPAIVIGAVLPDIPIFVFYFLMKFVYWDKNHYGAMAYPPAVGDRRFGRNSLSSRGKNLSIPFHAILLE